MKRAAMLGLLALLLVAGGVWAATAGPYDLPWSTVDGGGGSLTGGGYTLHGTAGQPDAGALSGGEFTLGGGFWRGGAVGAAKHRIYLPVLMRETVPGQSG